MDSTSSEVSTAKGAPQTLIQFRRRAADRRHGHGAARNLGAFIVAATFRARSSSCSCVAGGVMSLCGALVYAELRGAFRNRRRISLSVARLRPASHSCCLVRMPSSRPARSRRSPTSLATMRSNPAAGREGRSDIRGARRDCADGDQPRGPPQSKTLQGHGRAARDRVATVALVGCSGPRSCRRRAEPKRPRARVIFCC